MSIGLLVSTGDAKVHLRLDLCDEPDLFNKILSASTAVMKHLKLTAFPDEWILEDTSPPVYEVPYDIQAATLILLGELWEHRESSVYDSSENWKKVLIGHRDPSMA